MPSQIRVILADDHPIVRNGERQILSRDRDISVVGDAENGRRALELVGQLHPDILITDVEMPEMDGIETARQLRAQNNPVKILIVSSYNVASFIQEAFNIGVEGYMLKEDAPDCLVDAVHWIYGGGKGFYSKKRRPDG